MGKRYGIIADLHSNIEGLRSALAEIGKEGVDEILCLGDVVGYNADPCECVDVTFESCSHVIRGNHERYILGEMPEDLKASVVRWTEWGLENMPEKQIGMLRKCQDTEVVDDLLLIVHGSPSDRDEYLLGQEAVRGSLKTMRGKYLGLDVCFFGHTHLPLLVGGGAIRSDFTERTTVQLERLKTYLINPGSCGQPRDGCPKASCGIFDSNEWSMTYLRTEYDVKSAQEKVVAAGLDSSFAHRLEIGR